MTSLAQHLTNLDKPTVITATYFKRRSDEVIDRAYEGEVFIVTHRGKEKAAIVSPMLYRILSKNVA